MKWYQMRVLGRAGPLARLTRVGNNPFSEKRSGYWECPRGHSFEGAILSEVFLERSKYDGADISFVDTTIGRKMNLVMPEKILIVSKRFLDMLKKEALNGFVTEIAHLEPVM